MSDEPKHEEAKGAEEHGSEGHGGGGGGHGHGGGGHGHGGGGGHEEHAGAPEWLISFADNVALLMGFFVILLAMNMKEKTAGGIGGKDKYGTNPSDDAMLDFVIGMREAFNNPVSLESKDPKDGPLIKRMHEKIGYGSEVGEGVPGRNPQQQAIRPSDYNAVTAAVSFDDHSTTLSTEGKQIAEDVAKRLRGQPYIIEVRGHSSSIESSREDSPDAGLRLSFARAQSMAAALVERGLKWTQLRVVACSDNERLTPLAHDAAGHRTNQRVEIVVTNETMAADPHMRPEQ